MKCPHPDAIIEGVVVKRKGRYFRPRVFFFTDKEYFKMKCLICHKYFYEKKVVK